jgi:hypothetical protein
MADPDADGLFEDDVDQKIPVDDTGKKKPADAGEGEDAVVGDDTGGELDGGTGDDVGSELDAGPMDSGVMDTGPMDAGPRDTGPVDTGPRDTGPVDTGPVDTGPVDTGPVDTGPVDTGPTEPTIVCTTLTGMRTCRGSDGSAPCCIVAAIFLPPVCGIQVPIFGCLPN